jgi:hypothetical protein
MFNSSICEHMQLICRVFLVFSCGQAEACVKTEIKSSIGSLFILYRKNGETQCIYIKDPTKSDG